MLQYNFKLIKYAITFYGLISCTGTFFGEFLGQNYVGYNPIRMRKQNTTHFDFQFTLFQDPPEISRH